MEQVGKQTKKSTPRQIIFKREGVNQNGSWAIFEIAFDNGDKGDYFAKSNPQTDFKEGVEIEYTIEVKVGEKYTNTLIGLPKKGFQKGGGINPVYQLRQCALTNAVSMFNSGKIEKDKVWEMADKLLNWLQNSNDKHKTPNL